MRSEMVMTACMTCSIIRMVNALVPDGPDRLHHGGDLRRIEAGQDFVQQQQIRPGRQGPGQLQALLLGHVEAAGRLVGPVHQAHLGQGLIGQTGRGAQGVAFPAEAGPHHDVFPDRQIVEGPHHLVGPGQAPPGHLIGGQAGDLFAPENHLARGRGIDAVDHVEQGGFAGAVGADEPQDLALGQIEGDVRQGLEAAEALGRLP